MEREELEKKLNTEYKNVGVISIKDIKETTLKLSEIRVVGSILDNVEPLDSSEPIVVAKEYGFENTYHLIDGYHRLKHCQLNNKKEVDVVILEDYSITRYDDTLLDFMKKTVGKKIYFYDSYTFKLDDSIYYIKANEGCGGCSNGWSSIEVLPEFIGKNIMIKDVKTKVGEYEDLYDLYINDKLFAKVDTGWGNGYYGGDFEVTI